MEILLIINGMFGQKICNSMVQHFLQKLQSGFNKHICNNGVKLFFCLVFPNSQISKKSIVMAVYLNLQNDEIV